MDENLLNQLYELSAAFSKIGLRPLICGGLGIYLCLHSSQSGLDNLTDVFKNIVPDTLN
jgi:hypothetical protein